ncbi:transglutaminase family protein [Thermocrinis sp.]
MHSSILRRLLENSRGATLFWVYLSAGVGFFSLSGVADALYLLISLFFVLLGILMDYKKVYPIRRILLNTFGIAVTLYFLSQLSLENLVNPLSNLLLILLGIKFLEEKKPRDMYQILLLSLLCLSLATLYNLSLSFLAWLVVFSFLAITSLIFIDYYKQSPKNYQNLDIFRHYSKTSLLLFLSVLIVSIPFFVFLPRTQFPLLDVLGRKEGLKTGIAEEVSLGKMGEIHQDNTVVLRVFGLPQNVAELYWRVQVFDTYQENRWVSTLKQTLTPLKGSGEFKYTVILEPHYEDYLPMLDFPYSVSSLEGAKGQVYVHPGGAFRISTSVSKPVRYSASSTYEPVPEYEVPYLAYLDVPKDLPESIKRLAEELSAGAVDEKEKLSRVIKHFSKDYTYTLKLANYEGDPLEYFLFVSKKGNCEYYASATALLLRLMGIPSRVVGGFMGALWNPYGNYHVVTNSMAHVWVEAFIENRWVRVDTTPSYQSPGVRRISTLSMLRDAIISFWYTNVVGFSAEKQINIFKTFGKGIKWSAKKENLTVLSKYILLTIVAVSLLYFALLYYRRLKKTPENLYIKLKEILKCEDEPERLLERFKGSDLYPYVEYIVRLYQRHKYSNYRVYPDEVLRGYGVLKELKRNLNNSDRS